jgi:hypothetical protein
MSDLLLANIRWDSEEVGGFVKSANAVLVLGEPRSNPEGPATTLYLDIAEDEDLLEYVWRFGISEEDANFGPAEFDSGQTSDFEQAKSACLGAVVDFLLGEGYSGGEIVAAA